MKTCTKCSGTKNRTEFYRRKVSSDGLEPWCKQCRKASYDSWRRANLAKRAESAREWREKYPERVADSTRRGQLKYRYGISPEQYDAILEAQGGGCAICGVTTNPHGRRLDVDHDHACCPVAVSQGRTCGKCWRGILCNRCNTALGAANDDPTKLDERFVAYLARCS